MREGARNRIDEGEGLQTEVNIRVYGGLDRENLVPTRTVTEKKRGGGQMRSRSRRKTREKST